MNRFVLTIILTLVRIPMLAQNSAWDYSTKKDISGKVTEYATSGSLIVRCSRSCEVFFTPERYETVDSDSHSVLVRFDDKPVKRYGVSRSEDGTSYFFSDPIAILRAIRDNGGYMTIEYKPYARIAQTVKYGVWYLPPNILKRIEVEGAAQDKAHAAQAKSRKALKAECATIDEKMSQLKAYSDEWMTLRYKQIEKCSDIK